MTHWRDVGAITGEEVSALEKLLEFVVAITSDVSASPEVRASIPPEMLEGLQSYSTEVRQVLGPVVERWARRQAADEHDRIASHDDDPHASLVDRLLLALGMWPFYVDDLGPDALVKAAAKIRSDAHRFPMAAEDYGTKDEIGRASCRERV